MKEEHLIGELRILVRSARGYIKKNAGTNDEWKKGYNAGLEMIAEQIEELLQGCNNQ